MPRPRAGEDKEAYVSRFMASAEALRDYPDEKQRAAVAYSMFGEKKNNMQICPGCGAAITLAPDALVQDCIGCGHRLLGAQTPPTESLNNVCRGCLHPVDPEHDDFGCHIEGCGCTMTNAGAVAQIGAGLSNAAPSRADIVKAANDFKHNGATRASAHDALIKEFPGMAGDVRMVVDDVWPLHEGHRSNENAGARMVCPVCKGPNGVRFLDSQGGTRQMGAKPLDGYQCDDCDSLWAVDPKTNEVITENSNADDRASKEKKIAELEKYLEGMRQSVKGYKTSEVYQHVEASIATLKGELGNAGDGLWHLNYAGAGQPACGKTTGDGFRVATASKDVNCPKCLEIAARTPGAVQNAIRPAQEAFEAHVANCNACSAEYANAAPDTSKLCADGLALVTAKDLENSDAFCDSCDSKPCKCAKDPEVKNGRACATCGERAENFCTTCSDPVCDACAAKAGSPPKGNAYCPKCGSPEKTNSAGSDAAGGVWDKADNARRIELLKQASIPESAGGLVHLTWSQMPAREQAQITRTLGFENAQVDAEGGEEAGAPGGTVTVVNADPKADQLASIKAKIASFGAAGRLSVYVGGKWVNMDRAEAERLDPAAISDVAAAQADNQNAAAGKTCICGHDGALHADPKSPGGDEPCSACRCARFKDDQGARQIGGLENNFVTTGAREAVGADRYGSQK